jgi:hypothetical protein
MPIGRIERAPKVWSAPSIPAPRRIQLSRIRPAFDIEAFSGDTRRLTARSSIGSSLTRRGGLRR